jgi:hypothetical protein
MPFLSGKKEAHKLRHQQYFHLAWKEVILQADTLLVRMEKRLFKVLDGWGGSHKLNYILNTSN